MRHPFILGKKIYLRALEEADLDGPWFDWMNDLEVTRYLESGAFPNRPEDMRPYFEKVVRDSGNVMLAIVERETEKHIGNIKLGSVDRHHLSADIGLIIGEKDCWGKGFGTEAIALLSAYAFDTIGLHKLSAGIYAPNIGCIKAFQKAGFAQEGLLRDQCRFEDAYVDVVVVGRVNNHHDAGSSA